MGCGHVVGLVGCVTKPVLGLVPCAQGVIAGAFAWGDPFGMICTGSSHYRSYAVTT